MFLPGLFSVPSVSSVVSSGKSYGIRTVSTM